MLAERLRELNDFQPYNIYSVFNNHALIELLINTVHKFAIENYWLNVVYRTNKLIMYIGIKLDK